MRSSTFIRLLLISGIALTGVNSGRAQDLVFDEFNDFNDLGCRDENIYSQGIPFDFIQNSRGYLWCFNDKALIRYDGIEAKTYRHSRTDPTSISRAGISAIVEDSDSQIWIGLTGGFEGIEKFDPATERFEAVLNGTDGSSYQMERSVTALSKDSRGHVWAGTIANGLVRIDQKTGKVTRFKHKSSDPHSLTGNSISGHYPFLEDAQGDLWVIAAPKFPVRGGGLNRFNQDGETFRRYVDAASGLEGVRVSVMTEDKRGRLWIGATGGDIYLFDRENDTFVKRTDLSCSGQENDVEGDFGSCTVLFTDRSGLIWIGSSDQGLSRYDPEADTLVQFKHDPNDATSLPDNNIGGIWQTHDGMHFMAIGTRMYKVYSKSTWITSLPSGTHEIVMSDSVGIKTFHVDRFGNIWISGLTWGFGLLDPQTEMITWIPNSRGDPIGIEGFHESASGDLFVVSHNRREPYSTLWHLNRNKQILEPLFDADETYTIQTVAKDSSGAFWFGVIYDNYSRQLGFVRWYPDQNMSKRYGVQTSNPEKGYNSIRCLLHDQQATLWACASSLFRYRPGIDKFEEVLVKRGSITSLMEDSKGRFWVTSSRGGLSLLDRETGQTMTYGVEHGLPSNTVDGLLEDDYGYIWVRTETGLSRFDPENVTFRNFTSEHGLPRTYYTLPFWDEHGKGSDGVLYYLQNWKYFTILKPDHLVENAIAPQVTLEGISLFNESLQVSEDGPLKQAVWETKEIELDHNQNDLTFSYVGLHYGNPSRIRYSYMLEGMDAAWVDVGIQRTARYSHVPPGSYTFRVKAANPDGVWSAENAVSLAILIRPPWWANWWAYGSYLICLMGLVFGGYRWRTRRLRLRAAELEAMVVERTQQLADEKQTVEMQAKRLIELEQTKDRFFANISHEFRTPLMLMQGPIQDVIDGAYGSIGEQARRQLVLATRSGKQLHGLIDQLLDLSRLDVGQLHLRVEKHDLDTFGRSMADAFSSLAERNGISLTFSSGGAGSKLHFDLDKLEKVVGNLITNGVKNTDRGGRIEISTCRRTVGAVKYGIVRVKDSGTGIPAADLPRIFDRFYQVEPGAKKDAGTGIGLAFVRELVELHGGKVLADSTLGIGSTFEVLLPTGTAHLPSASLAPASEIHLGIETAEEWAVSDCQNAIVEIPPEYARVLVVEDNEDLRQYIVHHLSSLYRIDEAADGREGLKKARANPPALILADIMMPLLDGLAMCKEIRNDPLLSHIPVVLLTAKASQEAKLEGLKAGADDYLYKPFHPQELQMRIENLIELRRQLREQFSREVVFRPTDLVIQSDDEIFLNRVKEVVEAYVSDSNFTIDQLADEVAVSVRHLHRKMRELTRLSPAGYVRLMRMQWAARFLNARAGTVAEIALKVGYRSSVSFSQVFRQVFGVHPSEYTSLNSDG